jgi:hypothetical protein
MHICRHSSDVKTAKQYTSGAPNRRQYLIGSSRRQIVVAISTAQALYENLGWLSFAHTE